MACGRRLPDSQCCSATGVLRRFAVVGTMLVVLGAAAACTPALIGPGERETACRVVVEQFEAIEVEANPAADPAGGALVGAGSAALVALGVLMLNPLLVIQGAAGAAIGLGCGAAGVAHPNAEAEFRAIAVTADRGAIKQALEAELVARGTACGNATEGATTQPDILVRIDSVRLTMGCPAGRQSYYLTVKWRATSATSGKVLSEKTTRCLQSSSLDVDAWPADAERARAEVNGALAGTGRRMAGELLGVDKGSDCRLQPNR
jgi:hypothetical protein